MRGRRGLAEERELFALRAAAKGRRGARRRRRRFGLCQRGGDPFLQGPRVIGEAGLHGGRDTHRHGAPTERVLVAIRALFLFVTPTPPRLRACCPRGQFASESADLDGRLHQAVVYACILPYASTSSPAERSARRRTYAMGDWAGERRSQREMVASLGAYRVAVKPRQSTRLRVPSRDRTVLHGRAAGDAAPGAAAAACARVGQVAGARALRRQLLAVAAI